MISLDTETTGVDFYHGARPFFITTCMENGEQQWWEWNVDPLTREIEVGQCDLDEIASTLLGESLVLQNAKFDVAGLSMLREHWGKVWPWDNTEDTLVAG